MGVTGWWIELISTAAATMRSPRAALNGTRSNPIGVAAIELQQPTASLTGLLVPSGAIAAETQPTLFEAASGLEGAADATLRSPTAALTSAQGFSGTLASSLQPVTTALAGVQAQSGSMAATMQEPTTAATGTHATAGIQYIDSGYQAANSLTTMPTHQSGDLLIAIAGNVGTNTTASNAAGWSSVASYTSGNALGYQLSTKIAASSSEVSGTWTNAGHLTILAYRGAVSITTHSRSTGTSATLSYPAQTRTASVPNASWILRWGAHRSATNMTTNTPAGYTNRAGSATRVRSMDTNGAVASDPVAQTQSVNASAFWTAITLEIAQT